MIIDHSFCGQRCYKCGAEIWGTGVLDMTPEGDGTTSYHLICHKHSHFKHTLTDELVTILHEITHLADVDEFGRYVEIWADHERQCAFCYLTWEYAQEERHADDCPIKRGRILLEALQK